MLKKLLFSGAMVSILLLSSIAPVGAVDGGPVVPINPPVSAETGEMVNETPHLWFVELTGAPVSEGNSSFAVANEHKQFREEAKRQRIEYKEEHSYDSLWNGFSVSVPTSELGKLSRIPGVKAIYPVMVVSVPQTTASSYDPALYTSLGMIGADVAQSELGYTGKGIKVAVMDTGIDYDHPDLGGCFGPGCRVAMGWDFVGDAYNADDTSPSYNPVPVPDPNPDDCNGHGTHVAGIIGANGAVKGVAPEVTFGSYRVFGCEGSTTDDIMLAAMERIYKDKMQVLNMSIGSPYEWPQSPTAVAASRLVKKGIVVVASIGNNGANGLYSAGAPGLGDQVIGVASFDNTNVFLPYFEVNNTKIGYVTMEFSPAAPTSGTGEIVDVGLACDPLTADLTGKVALAARGTCAFGVKATNAIAAGADAVLVSNNAPGVFNGTLGAPLTNPKPVVGISMEDGAFIRAQTAPITMTWTDQMFSAPSPTGGLISSFSSYGLSPDLALKPDIGAPGGNIYSTFPLELGGYATLSGTSMSSPHVAGASALLLQALNDPKQHLFRHVDADEVRDVLQNNADPALWSLAPSYGILDSVHRQGAGMLRIDKAILATTRVQPAKISLGEGEKGPVTRTLEIENSGEKNVTYDLSFENALSTEGVIVPDFWDSDAEVSFNVPSITIPRHGEKKIKVTITPATYPETGQYGGYIILTPRGGGPETRVPFAGFVGDYQSIQVLVNPVVFPTFSVANPFLGDQFSDDTVTTFTMANGDLPYVWVHLDHQSRIFKIEAFNAKTNKSIGNVLQLEYMIRNSTTTSFFAFAWDGTTTKGHRVYTAPTGKYFVKVSVLKALGNADNPADWETWTSPVFTIQRP